MFEFVSERAWRKEVDKQAVVDLYEKTVGEVKERIREAVDGEPRELGDKTLILSGGNLRIPIAIGALMALQEKDRLRDYRTVMASSVGVLSAIYTVLDKPEEALGLINDMQSYVGKKYDIKGLIESFDDEELQAVLSAERNLIITVTNAETGGVLVYSTKDIESGDYDLPEEIKGDFEFYKIESVEDFRKVLVAAISFPVKTDLPADLPEGRRGFDSYNSARSHELLYSVGPRKEREAEMVDIGAVGAKRGPWPWSKAVEWIIDNELDQALWARGVFTDGARIFKPWLGRFKGANSFYNTYKRVERARRSHEAGGQRARCFAIAKDKYPNFGGSAEDEVAANFLFGYQSVRDELS